MAKNTVKIEVGSRWQFKTETKGRVFFVMEKMPFGRLMIKQEDRAVTGECTQTELLRNAIKLDGINDSLDHMSIEKMNREAHQPSPT